MQKNMAWEIIFSLQLGLFAKADLPVRYRFKAMRDAMRSDLRVLHNFTDGAGKAGT